VIQYRGKCNDAQPQSGARSRLQIVGIASRSFVGREPATLALSRSWGSLARVGYYSEGGDLVTHSIPIITRDEDLRPLGMKLYWRPGVSKPRASRLQGIPAYN
jgi:hypothetical protein